MTGYIFAAGDLCRQSNEYKLSMRRRSACKARRAQCRSPRNHTEHAPMPTLDAIAPQAPEELQFYESAVQLVRSGQGAVRRAANMAMVYTYFELGRIIAEQEQRGQSRAGYGDYLIRGLSRRLTHEFGRGFSMTNLVQMRRFYRLYSSASIHQTLSDEFVDLPSASNGRKFFLSWSHYIFLMGIENEGERSFYEIESARGGWSLAELRRQFNSALYERLALSRDKDGVRALAQQGQVIEKPADAIKDPYVLEFLGLSELPSYSETEMETRIIDHLRDFLKELGKGFLFDGRQVRFTFEDKHFKVDLVCYNRLLRCYVLFDLKIGELTHQDLGQMQMYVNYYDRHVKFADENPTIGVLLCSRKNDAIVELTLPEGNEQIFASRYQTVLPSKEELKKIIQEGQEGNGINSSDTV